MKKFFGFLAALFLCVTCLAQPNRFAIIRAASVLPSSSGGGFTPTGGGGNFTFIIADGAGAGSSGAGTCSTSPRDTTGWNFAEGALTAPDADLGAGTISFTDTQGNTWRRGRVVASTLTGFSVQQFYCTNYTGNASEVFTASTSISGGSVSFEIEGYSCSATPVFDGEAAGAGGSGLSSIQPGSLPTTVSELFATTAIQDAGSGLGVDSSFTTENQPVGFGSPALSHKISSTAENPTWSWSGSSHAAVDMMYFGSTGGGGGGGNIWFYSTTSSATGTLNGSGPSFIEWSPLTIGQNGTVDTLSINIHAVATSCNFRLALYNSSGGLIVASSAIPISNGGPFDSNFTASVTLTSVTAGNYFVAFAGDNDIVINTVGSTLGSYQSTIYSLFPQSTLGTETGHVGMFIVGAHLQ